MRKPSETKHSFCCCFFVVVAKVFSFRDTLYGSDLLKFELQQLLRAKHSLSTATHDGLGLILFVIEDCAQLSSLQSDWAPQFVPTQLVMLERPDSLLPPILTNDGKKGQQHQTK